MEESIRKAEELIEETNATLARMQHDTCYEDDFDFGDKRGDRKICKKLDFDDIARVITPREKILDDSFNLNKRHSIRADKIHEINRRIEAYKLELIERESVKALDESIPVTRTTSETNLSQRTVTKVNLAEDLKSKLQLTRRIVDRGIQTARELTETVEVLKSSREQKKCDELSERGSTISGKRCKRCNAEITGKTVKSRRKEDNVLVTRVKGRDCSPPRRRHKLNFQELPSLKIQGDLTRQRIPSVDIPPGKPECFSHPITNAAYETYSHEEIIRERIDKIMNDIKNSNGFAPNPTRVKSVECSHCGKVVKVAEKFVRTEQIDELLKRCDYNVFDPRIDEFVERLNCRKTDEEKCTQTEMDETKPVVEVREEMPKPERRTKVTELTRELTRKYREKATELESDHLEFEGILRELFDKMEESRALFKSCEYLNAIPEKKKSALTATPPVLLSYTGSGEEADDGRNAVLRPRRRLPSKVIRKNLEKKELEINCKLISSSSPGKDKSKMATPKPPTPTEMPKKSVKPPTRVKTIVPTKQIPQPEITPAEQPKSVPPPEVIPGERPKSISPPEITPAEQPKSASPPETTPAEQSKSISPPEISVKEQPKPISPPETVDLHTVEESVKETISDYESDFEEESIEEKSPERDTSHKFNARLSTITEVESELEQKLSDLAIAPIKSSQSSDDDDTGKLLKEVNKNLREVEAQQLKSEEEMKKSSEEVAEPLKEVLNALKNQFERTEILAEKLTESIKEVKKGDDTEEIGVSNGRRDLVMVYNLQRAKKNLFPPRSSLLSTRRKGTDDDETRSSSPSGSIASRRSISTGKSYSEGEISEQEVTVSDRSSPSIGEVINENNSDGSEEKSVIKFLY